MSPSRANGRSGLHHGPRPVLGLDRTIHTATRLLLMSALCHEGEATFARLEALTGVPRPNVAAQARALEEAGFVEVRSGKADLRLRRARLTPKGRRRLEAHWLRLDEVRRGLPFKENGVGRTASDETGHGCAAAPE